MSSDTIAAISTGSSAGGIGIVRISGENARTVADRVFKSRAGKVADMSGYTALYGNVYDENGEKTDECVVLCFAAPKSYTGEDVVELSCHGSSAVMRRLLRTVTGCGARLAQPGEFTRRAFENGKMSLTQAEAVMDIISADGDQALAAAEAAKDGALWKRLCAVKEALTDTIAWLSAWADFPEEDIPEVDAPELCRRIEAADTDISELIEGFDSGRAVREGIDTVIAGRPNVGKSTLMNLMTGHDSSIITDIPGTTRDIVSETVMLGGIRLNLSDTAGLHRTDDRVESIGIDRAKKKLSEAQLIIAVFDSSAPLSDDDRALIEDCAGKCCVAVINKSDLKNAADREYISSRIKQTVVLSASDEKSIGILSDAVMSAAGIKKLDPKAGILANERQLFCAKAAHSQLIEALWTLGSGLTLDAVTVSLESALESILSLSGERITDTVADNVFHRFCVGK